jgi:hypothetical protein
MGVCEVCTHLVPDVESLYERIRDFVPLDWDVSDIALLHFRRRIRIQSSEIYRCVLQFVGRVRAPPLHPVGTLAVEIGYRMLAWEE